MKLKKFNENVEESDVKALTDCSTIITYEFEEIEFKINENINQITFVLDNWLKKYGDISVSANFLKFNPDYIKLMQLFHEFIQSLDDYQLYITEFFSLTEARNPMIQLKYISPNQDFSLVKKDIPVQAKSFKIIIQDKFGINFHELLTSGRKTLILTGLATDFYNGPLHNNIQLNKLLHFLTMNDNPLVEFGIHWLSSNNTKPWDEFKKKVSIKMEYPFNIDDINRSSSASYNKLFFLKGAQHINLSLTFENNIEIIK